MSRLKCQLRISLDTCIKCACFCLLVFRDDQQSYDYVWSVTVNSEIFARILFSLIALNNIFEMLKIATRACFTCSSKRHIMISPFREDLFSRNFALAKFRENKTLAKISEFTVFFKRSTFSS